MVCSSQLQSMCLIGRIMKPTSLMGPHSNLQNPGIPFTTHTQVKKWRRALTTPKDLNHNSRTYPTKSMQEIVQHFLCVRPRGRQHLGLGNVSDQPSLFLWKKWKSERGNNNKKKMGARFLKIVPSGVGSQTTDTRTLSHLNNDNLVTMVVITIILGDLGGFSMC